MIEINFCGDVDLNLFANSVPREGEAVNIAKTDYIVTLVCWSVDYSSKSIHERKLRAIVELQKA